MELLGPGLGFLLLYLFIFLIGAIIITFTISVWKRPDMNQSTKILWMIFFILAPVLSIIFYLIFGYKKQNN
jgi:uncharacterized membrane protein YvlD (DUF360 family)